MQTETALTAAQMRALEKAAMDQGHATGLQLMERAGQGVIAAIGRHWPEWRDGAGRAIVLCGPGNNGGDGFVIARLLWARGWQVALYFLGDHEALPPDARANHDRWAALGVIRPFEEARAALADGCDLVVDAVFGTGLARAVPDVVRDTLLAALPYARVAVDFPSFVDTDTGDLHTDWPTDVGRAADLTVTFHARKRGHLLSPGMVLCGDIVVADIGL